MDKPCPFCGSNKVKYYDYFNNHGCEDCGASSLFNNWNNRPFEQAWIPVSKKKPEDGADCLCYDGTYDYVFIGWFEKGKFYKLDDDGGGSDIPYKIKTVTHWQPLPPPPDEEE